MKILTVIPLEDRHKELFKTITSGDEFIYSSPDKVSEKEVRDADIIIGNVNPSLIKGSSNLKWLQLNSAGTDGYTEEGVIPDGAYLTNATGAYGLAISEHMIACLLSLMKKLNLYGEDQSNHVWSDRGNVTSIWNSKTLVVGLGDIGSEFAMRMNALGSTVTGIRRTVSLKPDYISELYHMDKFYDCLAEADIVASCLPGNKETYRIYNREAFEKMKKGSYFINVGRGNAVDSMALADALNSGHLAGAAIDVTDPEPLPSDHPLWDAKNIIITPHISGMYHLPETLERIIGIAAENLKRFKEGRELINIVDFETGYRKH